MSLCEINWTYVKDAVAAFCSLLAVVIASQGLNTWRRQLSGTTNHRIAVEALKAAYALEHQFRIVRAPLQRRSQAEGESEREAENRHFQLQIGSLYEKLTQVRVSSFEARAVVGARIQPAFEKLEGCVSEYAAAVWLHFWLKDGDGNPSATIDRSPEREEQNQRVLFLIDARDELSKAISEAVSALERELKPYIGSA